MNEEKATRDELTALCRRVRRRTQDYDVFILANNLEGRLIDDISSEWGWKQPRKNRNFDGYEGDGKKKRLYTSADELLQIVFEVSSRTVGDTDIQTICSELEGRISVSPGQDDTDDFTTPPSDETSDERKKRYKREWMRKKRAGA